MYKQTVLPMYRGFNLSYLMMCDQKGPLPLDAYTGSLYRGAPFKRINEDLEFISDLGFNFVRLPLNYRNFVKNYDGLWQGDEFEFDEEKIEKIDKAVQRAGELGIYVELGLHRGPGYSVNPEINEPFSLWIDTKAKGAFENTWKAIAERYNSVASDKMGFNLINEPYGMDAGMREKHNDIMRNTVEKIRKTGDNRRIFIDGLRWGREYLPELCDMENVAQSTRAYDPGPFTHYGLEEKFMIKSTKWPGIVSHNTFSWDELAVWDFDYLYKIYENWAKMAQEYKVGVHCGEGGIYHKCPHEDGVRWFSDVMEILTGFNIGFAMWELKGPFGLMDSGRDDCKYSEYKGHLLDNELLDIMKRGF